MYLLTSIQDNKMASCYEKFTFPKFRSRLRTIATDKSIIAIAASNSARPIGLAIAEKNPDLKSAKILSLYMSPEYRCQGVGKALLTRLEQELYRQGYTHCSLVYINRQSTIAPLESLLQKNNWATPKPRMLVCKTTTMAIVNAAWMQIDKLPSTYSIFPWQEITPQERTIIQQHQEKTSSVPQDLFPFQCDNDLEPLNSLGVRYKGKVVGWLITHRLDIDTIRYTCAFIRQDLQKMARIIPLYVRAIQIQDKASISRIVFTTPYIHASMVRFVHKHVAPYSTFIGESKISSKKLSDTESEYYFR
jgi:GNAT superfamily N-acetyltransferase